MTKKQTLLITGAHSLLGTYFIHTLCDDYSIIATTHRQKLTPDISQKVANTTLLDITSADQTQKIINQYAPDIVIHLAGLSNIDFCERFPERAYELNVNGTKNIVSALKNSGARMLFASSNALFDGANAPYTEKDVPHPLNTYGKTKYEAEDIILSTLSKSIIIRFTTTLGWPPPGARGNDLSFYQQELKKKKDIYLVNDRFFNPIGAPFAADVMSKILTNNFSGILHVGGVDRVSRFILVKSIANILNEERAVLHPVTSDFFEGLAPRPLDATLDITKLKTLLNTAPPTLNEQLTSLLKNQTRHVSRQIY